MRQKSVSARELAEIAGVVPSAVMNWKRGHPIKTDSLLRIAVHFSVSVDSLLGRENSSIFSPGASSHNDATSPDLARSIEIRLAAVEDRTSATLVQLNEIRRLLVSLLAEGRHAPSTNNTQQTSREAG